MFYLQPYLIEQGQSFLKETLRGLGPSEGLSQQNNLFGSSVKLVRILAALYVQYLTTHVKFWLYNLLFFC